MLSLLDHFASIKPLLTMHASKSPATILYVPHTSLLLSLSRSLSFTHSLSLPHSQSLPPSLSLCLSLSMPHSHSDSVKRYGVKQIQWRSLTEVKSVMTLNSLEGLARGFCPNPSPSQLDTWIGAAWDSSSILSGPGRDLPPCQRYQVIFVLYTGVYMVSMLFGVII